MDYRGFGSTITVEEDALVLEHGRLRASTGADRTPRRIPLSSLTAVALRPATRLTNGSLSLTIDGRTPAGGPRAADPDTVMFRHRDAELFAGLHDWLLHVVEVNRQREPHDLAGMPAEAVLEPAGRDEPPAVPETAQTDALQAQIEELSRQVQELRADRARRPAPRTTAPSAPRRAAAPEVKVVHLRPGLGAQGKLNQLALDGWSVVGSAPGTHGLIVYTLNRPR